MPNTQVTSGHKIRVLHVDDDRCFLEVSKQILTLENCFEVEVALSADEAFKSLRNAQYDVVVSDFEMPHKNGLEFLEEIRKNGNDIPFILFTGKGREEVAIKALNFGADGYINKQGETETVYGELSHLIRLAVGKKRAENELKKGEAELKAQFEGSPDQIFILDREFKFVRINRSRYSSISTEELIGQDAIKFLLPHEREEAKNKINQCFATGEIQEFDADMGEGRFARARIVPLITDGATTRVLVIATETTECKKAEKALKESQHLIQKILNTTPTLVYIYDLVERVNVYANQEIMKVLGYSPDQIQAMGPTLFSRILHPEDAKNIERHHTKLAEAADNERFEIEYRMKHADGDWRWLHSMDIPFVRSSNGKVTQILGSAEDITEYKRNLQLLQQSEAKYHSLFTSMNEGVAVHEIVSDESGEAIDYRIIDVNPAYERLTGIKRGQAVDKLASTLYGTGEPPNLDIYAPAAETQIPAKFEVYFEPWKKHFEISVFSPVKGKFVTVFSDKTTQKINDEVLREQNAEIEKILDSVGDLLFVLDNKYMITRVGKNACEVFNKSPEELVGKQCYEVVHGITEPWPSCPCVKTLEDKEVVTSEVDDAKLNRPLLVTTSPILDEKRSVIGVVHTAKDITRIKQAEEELKIAADLFESISDSVIVHDLDGKIIYFNEAAHKLRGYTREEFQKLTIKDLESPDNSQKYESLLKSILEKGEKSFEVLSRRKDQTTVPVEVHASVIESKGKKTIVTTTRDCTERIEAEKQLADMNEKLKIVGSLTRHDIRNKLAAVNGNVYLLKKRLKENPTLLQFIGEIEKASKQMTEILDFERTFEQVGSEKHAFVEVGQLFCEATALISDLCKVSINSSVGDLRVFADSMLRQVFYNLMDNSIKHGLKTSKISLHHEEKPDSILLIYEDDGVGISPEVGEHLFEKGFGKGTGFGLFMVKKIIEGYGWTINEGGTAGLGAKFVIKIPKESATTDDPKQAEGNFRTQDQITEARISYSVGSSPSK